MRNTGSGRLSLVDMNSIRRKWSQLKVLLDNRLVANLPVWIVALPIIVKMTESIPDTMTLYPLGDKDGLTVALEVPFNWYLYYFAAIILVICRLIYVSFCPSFLRDYKNATEAMSTGMTVQGIRGVTSDYVRQICAKLDSLNEKEIRRLWRLLHQYRADIGGLYKKLGSGTLTKQEQELIGGSLDGILIQEAEERGYYSLHDKILDEAILVEKNQFLKLIIWDLLQLQDLSSLAARSWCTGLFGLSVALAAWPTLQGIAYVIQSLSSH